MNKIVVTGRTVEEAIQNGLQKWNVSMERVHVHIITQPTKGFIGLGSKEAKVELELIPHPIEDAILFLKKMFEMLNYSITIEEELSLEGPVLNLKGDRLGVIIGKRGQTLDALQHIVNLVANQNSEEFTRIQLDAEHFRQKRKRSLERLATQMASKVIQTNQDVMLEPMTALERKIIHFELQDHPIVTTYSIGEEPNRKIVITLKQ